MPDASMMALWEERATNLLEKFWAGKMLPVEVVDVLILWSENRLGKNAAKAYAFAIRAFFFKMVLFDTLSERQKTLAYELLELLAANHHPCRLTCWLHHCHLKHFVHSHKTVHMDCCARADAEVATLNHKHVADRQSASFLMREMQISELTYSKQKNAWIIHQFEPDSMGVHCSDGDKSEGQKGFYFGEFIGTVKGKVEDQSMIRQCTTTIATGKKDEKSETVQQNLNFGEYVKTLRGNADYTSATPPHSTRTAPEKEEDKVKTQQSFNFHDFVGAVRNVENTSIVRQGILAAEKEEDKFKTQQSFNFGDFVGAVRGKVENTSIARQGISNIFHNEMQNTSLSESSVFRSEVPEVPEENTKVNEEDGEDATIHFNQRVVDLAAIRQDAVNEAMRGRWQSLLALLPEWQGETAQRIQRVVFDVFASRIQAAWRGYTLRRDFV